MHALFPKMITLFFGNAYLDTFLVCSVTRNAFMIFRFPEKFTGAYNFSGSAFRVLLSVFGFGLPSWGFYVMPETIGSHVQNVVRGMALSLEPEPRKEGSSKKKKSKCNRND